MAIGVVSYGMKPVKKVVGTYNPNDPLGLGDGTGSTGSTGSGYTYLGDGTPSSTTSGAGSLLNAQTNAAKFAAEQAAATAAAEKARFGAQNQMNYLQTLLGQGVPASITGEIAAQETAGRDYINTQATNLLARLAGARDTGQQFTTQGYDTLKNYLTANPANAYAQAQRAVPTVTDNALAQYMQAQGVDPSMAQPTVDTANQQALGGATNYNQLLNVLTGAESAGQASRMSEEQMARALAGSQLQSIYGSGRANVESEQLGALNALATQISNARIAAQQAQTAQEQAIKNALAGLVGTGLVCPPGQVKSADGQSCVTPSTPVTTIPPITTTTVEPTNVAAKLTAVQQLAAVPVKASNTALQNKIDAFIAAKPNASAAAVAKAFPQLAATIAKKK